MRSEPEAGVRREAGPTAPRTHPGCSSHRLGPKAPGKSNQDCHYSWGCTHKARPPSPALTRSSPRRELCKPIKETFPPSSSQWVFLPVGLYHSPPAQGGMAELSGELACHAASAGTLVPHNESSSDTTQECITINSPTLSLSLSVKNR